MSRGIFESYNVVLFCMYMLLVLYTGFQMGRIAYYKHKVLSFQFAFFIPSFVWALLRALFWILMVPLVNNITMYIIIYWFPVNIQFSTFSLLVIYYAHLHKQQTGEWHDFMRKYIGVWAIINITFLILGFIWIGLGIKYAKVVDSDVVEPHWLEHVHGYFTGSVFLLLVAILTWHGWKASQYLKAVANSGSHPKASFFRVVIVTLGLLFLFTSRCIYDLISAIGTVTVSVSGNTAQEALFVISAFCLWEIIPTILVLYLFPNVTATTLGIFSKKPSWPFNSAAKYSIVKTTSSPGRKLPSVVDEQSRILRNEDNFFYGGQNHSPYNTSPSSINSDMASPANIRLV